MAGGVLPFLGTGWMWLIAASPLPFRSSPPRLVRVHVSTPTAPPQAVTPLHQRDINTKTGFSLEDDEGITKKALTENADMR